MLLIFHTQGFGIECNANSEGSVLNGTDTVLKCLGTLPNDMASHGIRGGMRDHQSVILMGFLVVSFLVSPRAPLAPLRLACSLVRPFPPRVLWCVWCGAGRLWPSWGYAGFTVLASFFPVPAYHVATGNMAQATRAFMLELTREFC